MIITEFVNINISRKNITHFKNKNYDVKINTNITVKVCDLIIGSSVKINAKCDICGEEKQLEYRSYLNNILFDNLYYCTKCKIIKIRNTKKERYGDEYYLNYDKYKKTCLDKYGVEHPSKTPNHINKIKNTKRERYGDENYNNKKKSLNTKRERYGDENYNNYEKYKQTNILKYGVDNVSKLHSTQISKQNTKKQKLINKYQKYNIIDIDYVNYNYIYQCNNHISEIPKTIFYNRLKTKTTLCTICNPVNNPISDIEKTLLDFIKNNYDKEILYNTKNIIKPYELDIYLPDLNLAFEFNGVYWHNELYRTNNYHNEKTNLCLEKGIQLIHIYEDDWIYKQDIVKSIILNKLNKTENKIFTRKTLIKEINDNDLVKNFLDNNHIHGYINSSIKIGLFYDNELVSLMIFKKLKDNYELVRFCNVLNTNVIGGIPKLFKYFINNYKPSEIISYVDRGYSNGELYKQLGFELDSIIPPNYYYVIDGIRKHRFGFRKNVLVKQGFDPNKSEHEIMLERKIYRIYNSGNYKFKLINKNVNNYTN